MTQIYIYILINQLIKMSKEERERERERETNHMNILLN